MEEPTEKYHTIQLTRGYCGGTRKAAFAFPFSADTFKRFIRLLRRTQRNKVLEDRSSQESPTPRSIFYPARKWS